jgi:hypothetical protein
MTCSLIAPAASATDQQQVKIMSLDLDAVRAKYRRASH